MNTRIALSALTAALIAAAPLAAQAQNASRIGFVNSDRLMREAQPAKSALSRIESDFSKRDQDLQSMAKNLQRMQDDLERNGMTMSEADRVKKERAFNDLNRDYQRKKREFGEDLNLRRNEELAGVLDRANEAIRKVAQAEGYDIILQEAVYINPSIDITEKVIAELNGGK
ncbi:MAG: OmpH family outer membrane protein [Rhodocyclaceae bacterium]|nr:OmpH family outer membrane protein [Rhodocyclaceae bacterium]